MADKIMIIRHAEKPTDDGLVRGVSMSGERNPDELSVRGWQRAGALISLFAPTDGRISHRALARPDVIFAVGTTSKVTSLRAQHTVAPLAELLNKHVDIKNLKGDEKKLAEEAKAAAGVALISWEHKKIPELILHVTGDDTLSPQKWPDERFDLVWVLDR